MKRQAISHSRKQFFAKPHLVIETSQCILSLLHRTSFHFIYKFDIPDIEKRKKETLSKTKFLSSLGC